MLKSKPSDIGLVAVASNNLLCLNRDQNIFDSKKRLKAATVEGLELKLTSSQRRQIARNSALLAMFTAQVSLMNYIPHSLTLVTPNPTSSPSTQLFLVYNTYEYPHREEEKDSRMAGFKLGVFDREAHLIGPQESGCSTIGRSQKAVWILAQFPLPGPHVTS